MIEWNGTHLLKVDELLGSTLLLAVGIGTRLPDVIVVRRLDPGCVVCVLTDGAFGGMVTMGTDVLTLEGIVKHPSQH